MSARLMSHSASQSNTMKQKDITPLYKFTTQWKASEEHGGDTGKLFELSEG